MIPNVSKLNTGHADEDNTYLSTFCIKYYIFSDHLNTAYFMYIYKDAHGVKQHFVIPYIYHNIYSILMACFYVIYKYVFSKWKTIRPMGINQYDNTMTTNYDITMGNDVARDTHYDITIGN